MGGNNHLTAPDIRLIILAAGKQQGFGLNVTDLSHILVQTRIGFVTPPKILHLSLFLINWRLNNLLHRVTLELNKTEYEKHLVQFLEHSRHSTEK